MRFHRTKISAITITTAILATAMPASAKGTHSAYFGFDDACTIRATHGTGNGFIPSVAATVDQNKKCGYMNVKLYFTVDQFIQNTYKNGGYENLPKVEITYPSPPLKSDHNIINRQNGIAQGYRLR